MKTILLHALITVPSEEGQKKIDDALERDITGNREVFRDDHGRSREDYEEMNIKIPKYFDEDEKEFYKNNPTSEIDIDGNIFLQESEIEELTVPMFIPLDNIDSFVATLDGTTRVYTKSGIVYNVAEDVFEIDSYIELLSMSWWEKLKLSFQSFFRRKQKYSEDILDKEI
jgi:hypothetical protein